MHMRQFGPIGGPIYDRCLTAVSLLPPSDVAVRRCPELSRDCPLWSQRLGADAHGR
jgi:hypothetical protein